jgi:transposase
MASLQQKTSHGQKYWYIVESRRVNGKPRPVVLAYLGKAEDLLQRLQGISENPRIKSYSHGAVAALLDIAHTLDVPTLINQHVDSSRSYMAKKPIRNHLTVGATLLLGAIGRVCMMTSKRGWWTWAQTTSCEYLLRCKLDQIDSQHFWDLMDALPVEAIETIESELLQRVRNHFAIQTDTLFYDTSNFFTYIATTNDRCALPQRGKNKQRRNDLRQIGLAMVVTREDYIPLFHLAYEGNRNDSVVFQRVHTKIKKRLTDLGLDLDKHTLVFDRGNNSKSNLKAIKNLGFHYVGALTPYHHKPLVDEAIEKLASQNINEQSLQVYRTKRDLWGETRTIILYVSERFKDGQLRGFYHLLEKKENELKAFQTKLHRGTLKIQDREKLERRITDLIKGQFMKNVFEYSLEENSDGRFQFAFQVNHDTVTKVEEHLGIRMLMTDRHEWNTEDIINAYHGQANVELAFKNMKNPYHIAVKPQFHWTDQKITIHYFMGVLGYLLATLVWRLVRQKIQYKGTLDNLLDSLNNIRLATLIEKPSGRGKPKVRYTLEEISPQQSQLMEALNIHSIHLKRPRWKGVGVYKNS